MKEDKQILTQTFPEQEKFINSVLSGKYQTCVFAGTIRAGKTITCCLVLILLCKVYPSSRWYIIGQDIPTLKRTVIPSFFKYACPPSFVKDFNKSELVITCQNNSQIQFMAEGFQEDPELNRFKGLEANGFYLHQAEGLHENTYLTCIQRSGQWKLNPMPPNVILADLNPSDNWCKTRWYDKYINKTLSERVYVQLADLTNNPHIDPAYLESLKELPPEMYRRFVEGRWDAVDHINRLISSEAIRNCYRPIVEQGNAVSLGVDVGHRGPDPTTAYIMRGGNIIAVREYDHTKTTEVRDLIKKMMAEFRVDANHTVVDAVGVGAGVVDELEEQGIHVIAMRGGEREIVKDINCSNFKFAHWKAWSYWIAADAMRNGEIGNFQNDKLISDASAIWYFIRGDKEIITESKDDLRKRIGRSCDHWDAFVYAYWGQVADNLFNPVASFYSTRMLLSDLEKEREPQLSVGI